jgi:hypothetical protein
LFGIRTGQWVSTQVAAVALLIGAVNGPIALGAAAFPAIALLAVTWLRLRGRWAFEWLEHRPALRRPPAYVAQAAEGDRRPAGVRGARRPGSSRPSWPATPPR